MPLLATNRLWQWSLVAADITRMSSVLVLGSSLNCEIMVYVLIGIRFVSVAEGNSQSTCLVAVLN